VNFSVVLTKYGITQLKKILFLDGYIYIFPSLIKKKQFVWSLAQIDSATARTKKWAYSSKIEKRVKEKKKRKKCRAHAVATINTCTTHLEKSNDIKKSSLSKLNVSHMHHQKKIMGVTHMLVHVMHIPIKILFYFFILIYVGVRISLCAPRLIP